MKQGFIANAHGILTKLYDIPGLPFGLSSCLFNLKRRLDPFVEHQIEQQTILLEENSTGRNPDGSYTIAGEKRDIVTEAISKMLDTEVEYDYNPVKIEISDELFRTMGLTGKMIESLKGIMTVIVNGKTTDDFEDFSEGA